MKGMLSRTFLLPVLIGVLAFAGLISALLGDGLFDYLSWMALGIGIATLIWARLRAAARTRK